MTTATVMVDVAGRIVIPAKMRQSLGVENGGELIASLMGGRLELYSKRLARHVARQTVKALVPPDVSLADELSADRSREAE